MLKIGITGGIGSGKSTVCKMFEKFGIPVYYADDRAQWLMNNDEIIKKNLKENFGELVYDKAGILDRKYLSNIIFNDKEKLEIVNSIVHPAVFDDSARWQEQQELKEVPYSLKEAALLFETGSYLSLDKIIVVTAPKEMRIERVMQRDDISKEDVIARMDKQMSQDQKDEMAHFLINNINLEDLELQVTEVHQQLLKLAKENKE